MESMAQVEVMLRDEEEERLITTFAKKGIDWTGSDPTVKIVPNLDVQVSVVGEILAGHEVEVQAR